jgi:hypothetical protein
MPRGVDLTPLTEKPTKPVTPRTARVVAGGAFGVQPVFPLVGAIEEYIGDPLKTEHIWRRFWGIPIPEKRSEIIAGKACCRGRLVLDSVFQMVVIKGIFKSFLPVSATPHDFMGGSFSAGRHCIPENLAADCLYSMSGFDCSA